VARTWLRTIPLRFQLASNLLVVVVTSGPYGIARELRTHPVSHAAMSAHSSGERPAERGGGRSCDSVSK
jgi:hypothetical protein